MQRINDGNENDIVLNITARRIFTAIQQNDRITTDEIMDAVSKSRRTVFREIAKLKKAGWVKRVGPGRMGHWKITK
jgi:predicted HTH transcriptional regulator